MTDSLLSSPSAGKRIAAIVTVATLLINVAGWASSHLVGYSQMRTEVQAIRETGSTALKVHTEDALKKFVDQERRIVRLETKMEEIDTRLSNIQTDLREVLREVRR
jgi:hypothetical protein